MNAIGDEANIFKMQVFKLVVNRTMLFLYLMVCSIQKKILQHYVGALRSYGPLKYVTTSKYAMFYIFNTETSMYQVI